MKQAPEGESQPSVEVDLFVSTEKIMVLNTDLQVIALLFFSSFYLFFTSKMSSQYVLTNYYVYVTFAQFKIVRLKML